MPPLPLLPFPQVSVNKYLLSYLLCVSHGVLGASMGHGIVVLNQLTWHVPEGLGVRDTGELQLTGPQHAWMGREKGGAAPDC